MSPSLHTQFNNGGVGHVGNQRVISPVDAYDPHAEPEFLTDGERLEVVLGDTVVLPCQLRNLGKTSIQSLFLLISIILFMWVFIFGSTVVKVQFSIKICFKI